VEVDQQSEAAVRQPKLGKQLGLVKGRDSFDGFDLYYDRVVNQKIDAVTDLELYGVINDRQADLSRDRVASRL